MADLQVREKEIFETLKALKDFKFVIIGGYAVNAYTLPRFSIDCDLVVLNNEESNIIEKELLKMGYYESNVRAEFTYKEGFKRYEKQIKKDFAVSLDILIGEVLDRQTNASFSAVWVFENSKIRSLKGKTITEELKLKIIDLDALFVMKMLSCRMTDIRDIFLLSTTIKDKKWIKKEVSKRYSFEDRLEKIKMEITSKQFKDGLQGVFGSIDQNVFVRSQKLILSLEDSGRF